MINRDLGGLGESVLSLWAAARGIAAQRASKDVSGWDFLLEFPSKRPLTESGQPAPMDLAKPPLKCLVQVKATDQAERFSVKLSSALKLAQTQLPAFFVLLRFRGTSEPVEAYLVHMDRKLLERVFRRSREAEIQGISLSNPILSLSPKKEQLIEASGFGLESAILRQVGEDTGSYSQMKEGWIETVGYEEGGRTFSFGLPDGEEKDLGTVLVELAIGLRSEAPIENIRIEDRRFGIGAQAPMVEASTGFLAASPVPIDGELIFRFQEKSAWAKLEIFAPHGLGRLVSSTHLKFRLKHEFFEILLANKNLSANWNWPPAEKWVRLDKLFEVASLLEVSVAARRLDSDFELTLDSPEMGKWSFPVSFPELPESLSEVLEAIRDARAVGRFLELRDDLEVQWGRLAVQRMRFRFLVGILDPSGPKIEVFLPGDSGEELEGTRACLVQVVEVDLGSWWGSVVATLTGRIHRANAKTAGEREFVLEAPDRRVVKRVTGRTDQPRPSRESLEAEASKAMEEGVVRITR